MRTSLFILAILAAVAANPRGGERIMGGDLTTINVYPFAASILSTPNLVNFWHHCGGAIINTRAILTSAQCLIGRVNSQVRVRVGSSYANFGGTVYLTQNITTHASFRSNTLDNDIGILRTTTTIAYVINAVAPASIASNVPLDNQPLWAIGWGTIYAGGPQSEQLRHVQLWSVNQVTCRTRYAATGWGITANMLCAGWLDLGGRGQCFLDEGSPLLYNSAIVGIYSFSFQCGQANYPSVNTRVSRYLTWIQTNS